MLSRIEFLVTETFISLRRHPAMASAAIICVAAALFVSGIVGLAILNANDMVTTGLSRVRFVIFFHTDTKRDEAQDAADRIAHMPGVASVEFVTKEDGWKKMLEKDPDLEKFITNPLPDSVVVKAADVATIPSLETEIKKMSEVDTHSDAPEISTFLLSAGRGVRGFGTILGIVLGLISLVIIHHTIDLTLYARRKEIQIMSLVGATPATVAMPFLLEGIVYGLIGGVIAIGGLYLLYQYMTASVMQQFGFPLLALSSIFNSGVLTILGVGAALGLFGSLASVLKYLNRPRSKVTNA